MFTTHFYKALLIISAVLFLSACTQDEEQITLWPTNTHCNLHQQSCSIEKGDAQVTLNISPQPVPIARPLAIGVQLHKIKDVEKVELDIAGVNMYMGFNRISLEQTSPTIYEGTSMLAFCTTKDMSWQVSVLIHLKNGEQIQVPYILKTSNKM